MVSWGASFRGHRDMAVFEGLCCVDGTMKYTLKRQTAPMTCRGSRQHREGNDRTCAQRWPLPPAHPRDSPAAGGSPPGQASASSPPLGHSQHPHVGPAVWTVGGARGGPAQATSLPSPSMLWAGGGEGLARGSPPCPPSSGRNPPPARVARRSLQGVSGTSPVVPGDSR